MIVKQFVIEFIIDVVQLVVLFNIEKLCAEFHVEAHSGSTFEVYYILIEKQPLFVFVRLQRGSFRNLQSCI